MMRELTFVDIYNVTLYYHIALLSSTPAIDNKHNVISQLGALEEILSAGTLPKRKTYVAIGHDEEIQGYDGARFLAKRLETENVKFEFILDEGTMCVSGAIPGYKEPVALIGCAEKGYMNVELTVSGSGGHSSAPPLNEDNPMTVMSKAIIALESNHVLPHFQKNTAFRNTLEYIADKVAFPFSFIFSNFWFFGSLFKHILVRASNGAAASIRTTTVVTKIYGGDKINSIPTNVKAYVNHRVHPNDSIEEILYHDR
jgi:Acetylornithine deacetylase/Succinyl-diaminopimelate desuccinylase and related deacylases